MKIKTTFVTNSSSASFTILKKHLTDIKIQLIHEHIEIAAMVLPSGREDGKYVHFLNDPQYRFGDEWEIIENEDSIGGSTSMDNFDMYWFLTKMLNIPKEHIDYDHS